MTAKENFAVESYSMGLPVVHANYLSCAFTLNSLTCNYKIFLLASSNVLRNSMLENIVSK